MKSEKELPESETSEQAERRLIEREGIKLRAAIGRLVAATEIAHLPYWKFRFVRQSLSLALEKKPGEDRA